MIIIALILAFVACLLDMWLLESVQCQMRNVQLIHMFLASSGCVCLDICLLESVQCQMRNVQLIRMFLASTVCLS